MRGVLLVAVLSVKSNYGGATEEPLQPGDAPDTVQWWLSSNGNWRIRTYAADHDIHIHDVGDLGPDVLDFARGNNAEHYGDILAAEHEIHISNANDATAVAEAFTRMNLAPWFDVAADRFVFWRPDDAIYRSRSTPA